MLNKKYIITLVALFVSYFTNAQYPFGGWTTVKIETKLPPNPIEKPCAGKLQGVWKPILIEDFVPNPNFTSGLNEKKWNLGEFKDDSPCSPKGTSTSDPRNLHAIVNPENAEDGLLQMDATSEKHDSCLNFAGGLGAELMTFSAKEDYRSFWLYPDSYMELRVKQTFGFTLGVGIYLYAAWQPYVTEIDFCETLLDPIRNQDSKTWSGNNNDIQDEYSNGYIWGESYQHPNFSCQNKVQVKNMQGKPVNMEGEWLIWGLEWHKNVIRYYLNNVLQREIDLSVPPDCKYAHGQMYYPPLPMSFRFTHNNVTSERNRIPDSVTKSIFVDYIRVYQPTDSLVTKEIYIPKKICQGNGDNISVRYYPDIQYEWSSPAFDFVPKEMDILAHSFCEMQWVSPKTGLSFGVYPINLKATLPDGSVETQEWWVEYGYENPPYIANIEAEPIESSPYYQLVAETIGNSQGFAWSLDSLNWKGTQENNWQPFLGGQNLDIWVKCNGVCGVSPIYKENINIPISPESSVIYDDFLFTNPIEGERVVQEIIVYNMMGTLIRRRLILLNDSWEGIFEGLITGMYIVMYRDKEGKIISLNKVYVSP